MYICIKIWGISMYLYCVCHVTVKIFTTDSIHCSLVVRIGFKQWLAELRLFNWIWRISDKNVKYVPFLVKINFNFTLRPLLNLWWKSTVLSYLTGFLVFFSFISTCYLPSRIYRMFFMSFPFFQRCVIQTIISIIYWEYLILTKIPPHTPKSMLKIHVTI